MNKVAIIVAAGTGSRMGSEIPKQFLALNGQPVLMHSLLRFHEYDKSCRIIVVLPSSEIETWNKLIKEKSFLIPHSVVAGGATRFESVRNGLSEASDDSVVAIHDGVRPLCTTTLIGRCFDEAEKKTNAIPSIPITDTIRKTETETSTTVNRENFRIIQTPQCFHSSLLKKAYKQNYSESFTDDASVFEKDGNKIHLIEGERTNIKITIPADLEIAAFLEKKLFTSQ